MQALDVLNVLDSPLRWETERQNRIHQEALEQKKKQPRTVDARKDLRLIANPAQDKNTSAAVTLPQEWVDKVRNIPDMRSALIPLDEQTEGSEWSKPFSLCKADMEPWLSFYQGYRESRLFLENASADQQDASQLDFPVRALLELKQAGANIILQPPVQINGLVEYHDLEGELNACRDQVLAKALFKVANEVHQNHLRKAVERGRAMGNLLHDALMGDGHANLIRAWEKVYKRKPTIDELHQMLTTGRVRLSEKRQSAPEPKAIRSQERMAPSRREAAPDPEDDAIVVNVARTRPNPTALPPEEREKTAAPAQSQSQSQPTPGKTRAILVHVLQATVCCAALAALVFLT
ncbi:hypothetical protein [Herbaspirillum sp. ST 5-3]|uniref:hypothetical protein n=1 Tax=Herbaspirillum sp. ST 5-3 TaxID=2567936 RepID=UPI0010A4B921|nr:hypothetical protein [Herbaspirillum sp. ST 5-3]